MNYSDELKDPRWQRKRLEKMQAADWKCEICGDGKKTLHVHHTNYYDGLNPWEYGINHLECLCEHCHALSHIPREKIRAFMDRGLLVLGAVEKRPSTHEFWLLKLLFYHSELNEWCASVLNIDWVNHTTVREIVKERLWPDDLEFMTCTPERFMAERGWSDIMNVIIAEFRLPRFPVPNEHLADVVLRIRNQFLDGQIIELIRAGLHPSASDEARHLMASKQKSLRELKRTPILPPTTQPKGQTTSE